MLHNARTEYQEEAHEIATYTVIDSLAKAVGDKQTAKLARDILRQEERMQQFLAELLPQLSVDVAHDEIPVSEIDGPGRAPDGGGLEAQELGPYQGNGLTALQPAATVARSAWSCSCAER